MRRVSLSAIEAGWDELVRLVASIRAGKVSAAQAVQRLGSAAIGDPLHRAAEHLGRLLRTLFLCDYLAIPDYRREIHTLLNRGESVHQLQRAIYGGAVGQERGRRRQEMAAISGAYALRTNIVLAWNTSRIDAVVARLKIDGIGIEDDWLRRIGPAHFSHVNFRGTFRFNVERYASVLVQSGASKESARRSRDPWVCEGPSHQLDAATSCQCRAARRCAGELLGATHGSPAHRRRVNLQEKDEACGRCTSPSD